MDKEELLSGARELGLELTSEQLERFEAFEADLYEANSVMNLTRISREECVKLHFLDCLMLSSLLEPGASLLDIGTGPGFPAWPLACARPDLQVVGLDSSGKYTRFLDRQILPNLEVCQERAEDWGIREEFDVVTGRAAAPLLILLELSAAPCQIGGRVIPMRSAGESPGTASGFARKLGLDLTEVITANIPGTDVSRQFPIFEKKAVTPNKYPRSWSEIKKEPGK